MARPPWPRLDTASRVRGMTHREVRMTELVLARNLSVQPAVLVGNTDRHAEKDLREATQSNEC